MKRMVCCLLVIMLMVAPTAYGANGTTGEALKELGILNGDANGDLKEASLITRQEMVAVVNRLGDDGTVFVAPHMASFSDVPKDSWAFADVEKALKNNVTSGIGNGKFGWNQNVTYKQAVAFMLKVLKVDFEWGNTLSVGAEQGLGVDGYAASEFIPRAVVFELMGQTLLSRNSYNVVVIDSLVALTPQARQTFKNNYTPSTAVAVVSEPVEEVKEEVTTPPVKEEPVAEEPVKEEVVEESKWFPEDEIVWAPDGYKLPAIPIVPIDMSQVPANDDYWTDKLTSRALYEMYHDDFMIHFSEKTFYGLDQMYGLEVLKVLFEDDIAYENVVTVGFADGSTDLVAFRADLSFNKSTWLIDQTISGTSGDENSMLMNLRVFRGEKVVFSQNGTTYQSYLISGDDTLFQGKHSIFILQAENGHVIGFDYGIFPGYFYLHN